MPWEKSFNVEKSLDAAMRVFWQQGYQRTTMQELIKHMGINPGSIYGTFGNKRSLFVDVLRFYAGELHSWFMELTQDHSPSEAILSVLETIKEEYNENPGQCNGCLLVNAALEMAPHDTEISGIINQAFEGQRTEDINPVLDPEIAVDTLVALTLGLRVVMRLPDAQDKIDNVIRQAEKLIKVHRPH